MYYSEKFNSISHLVGAALTVIGLGALITVAMRKKKSPNEDAVKGVGVL